MVLAPTGLKRIIEEKKSIAKDTIRGAVTGSLFSLYYLVGLKKGGNSIG